MRPARAKSHNCNHDSRKKYFHIQHSNLEAFWVCGVLTSEEQKKTKKKTKRKKSFATEVIMKNWLRRIRRRGCCYGQRGPLLTEGCESVCPPGQWVIKKATEPCWVNEGGLEETLPQLECFFCGQRLREPPLWRFLISTQWACEIPANH